MAAIPRKPRTSKLVKPASVIGMPAAGTPAPKKLDVDRPGTLSLPPVPRKLAASGDGVHSGSRQVQRQAEAEVTAGANVLMTFPEVVPVRAARLSRWKAKRGSDLNPESLDPENADAPEDIQRYLAARDIEGSAPDGDDTDDTDADEKVLEDELELGHRARRAIADQPHTIPIPVHLVETISKLARTAHQLQQELNREATPEEIAEAMGPGWDAVT